VAYRINLDISCRAGIGRVVNFYLSGIGDPAERDRVDLSSYNVAAARSGVSSGRPRVERSG
jgi:hypothetical protein